MATLGLMVVGGHWVLGLASLPVPEMQKGQAARRFGGLGAQAVGTALGKGCQGALPAPVTSQGTH